MRLGLAHATLLWIGDILFVSSVVGFLILLFFRVFEEVDTHLRFWRRLLLFLLPIGLAINIGWASLGYDMANSTTAFDPVFLVGMMLLALGGPALSLSYVGGVVMLYRNPAMARLLAPFAAVGRLALTNYLIHSIVMTTIFYGYGLGLLGSVGVAEGVFIGILLYALQVPFSRWWLKRFRFGPFEWLWRSLTYGRLQPIRV